MPRSKQVKRLCDICIYSFNNAVLDYIHHTNCFHETSLENMELSFTCPNLGNIQPFISESLLHSIEESNKLNDLKKLIILKMYKHKYMTKLNVKFKLPSVNGFYEQYLKDLNHLVILNLTKVCTDEILEVVGENCPLLEIIYITSKTESVSNKSRKELNALKLKFFVSDKGLEYLHKCKHLRKIYMDKIIRSCCGGRKITHNGIRSLLNALPNIRYINYEDMGTVLEGWEYSKKSLNLIHLHDNHITPKHVKIFSKLCPSIQILCLAVPTVVSDPEVSRSSLKKLANSNLPLKSLVLKSFPFDTSFQQYLEIKGELLTTLSLDHELSITTQCLITIGSKCKYLENLAVKLLHPSQSDYELVQSLKTCKFFTCLKNLKLFGVNWKPYIVFELCMHNSKDLESLVLFNRHNTEQTDESFEILSSKNPLTKLNSLSLLDGFPLNSVALVNFVLGCTNLKEITFKSDSGYDKVLEEIVMQKNLDLNIKVDTIATYTICLCQI